MGRSTFRLIYHVHLLNLTFAIEPGEEACVRWDCFRVHVVKIKYIHEEL